MHTPSLRLLGLLLLATLAACRKQETPVAPLLGLAPKTATPDPDALRFLVASPKVTKAPRPARYDASPPTSDAALADSATIPPPEYLRLKLASGDLATRARFFRALNEAAVRGPLSEQLADYYLEALGTSELEVCHWLAEALPSTAPHARTVLFNALTNCDDPAFAPVFERPDSPDEAIVRWYFELHEGPVAFSPRFVAAARHLAKTAATPDELRDIGFGFARMNGPVRKAVQALLREVGDPHRRAVLSLGLLQHPSPEVRALGARACEHPKLQRDAMCSSSDEDEQEGDDGSLRPLVARYAPKPPPALDAGLTELAEYFGPYHGEVLKRVGPEVFSNVLARCARSSEYAAGLCLHRLALLDRDRALRVSTGPAALELRKHPDGRVLVNTLRRYPDGGLLARLVDGGIVGTDDALTETANVTVEDFAQAAHRVHRFDVETGMFPNNHHELALELAALPGDALKDVLFEEVAPPEAEMDTGPYSLVAFMDGSRFEVTARNYGDWYDVEAVLGLINALLIERESAFRCVTLATGDQIADVLCAPRAALSSLAKDGLLIVDEPNTSMRAGKDFEDQAFKQLGGSNVE